MKPLTALLGITAACAACCAIPFAVPVLMAATGFASGFFGMTDVAIAIGVAAAIILAMALWQRVAKKRGCA